MTDSLDLTGRVAVVTGAAGGLGRAEALALARLGAAVLVTDIADPSPTVAAVRAAGGEAVGCQIDLADRAGPAEVVAGALDAYGDLHVVVNNAGLIRDRTLVNLSDDDWDQVIAVNLTAPFRLIRAATREWRRAGPGSGPRTVVNTSSESGLYGNVGQANYAAAKAGLVGLSLTLAGELERYAVRVNTVAPRARTPMSDGAFGALPRLGSFDPFAAEHVAAVVAWLASDAAADVTGQVLLVYGGDVQVLHGWMPGRAVRRGRPWTAQELATLTPRLFHGLDPRHVPAPVRSLFSLTEPATSLADQEGPADGRP